MSVLDARPTTSERAPSSPPIVVANDDRYFPLWQIVNTRIKEFFRHPEAIFWVYVFPILMAIVLGTAFQSPNAERFQVAIQDGPGAQELADALQRASQSGGHREFEAAIVDAQAGRRDLKSARTMLVVIPSADGAAKPELAQLKLEYLYDPTRPESVAARQIVDDVLQQAAGRREVIAVADKRFDEPGGRYIDFLVPGLLGASLMSGGMWGVGFVIVDLRVRHLLKRFITTPMRRSDFLAGLMISRFFFMVTDVVVMLLCVWLFFNVRNYGSWPALALFVIAGSLCFAGIGLLVACRAQTLETASGLINLVMLPMWLVSGIFFSSERFPDALQPLIRSLPLTAVIDGSRAIMVEGVGLAATWPQLVVLLVWTIVSFVVALKLFRWY